MGNRFTFSCLVMSLAFFSCKKETLVPEQAATNTPVPASVQYEESRILRAPGNYQSWNVAAAPKLVAANGNGEYEGYIDFSLNNTEFWLVKGTHWNNVTTYNETGNYTFGHNGGYFTLPEGAGVYKVNASTNSFTWSCKKIRNWSVYGVVSGGQDAEMVAAASGLSWSITGNFKAGSFVFRANHSNEIVFGQNAEMPVGVPAYDGDKIQINKTGSYTISLSLEAAGNYVYSIRPQ